jgi:hypothetical protein
MFCLEDCWRFSLDGEGRTPARGTGSLEGRGIPLGLGLFVGSISRLCSRQEEDIQQLIIIAVDQSKGRN